MKLNQHNFICKDFLAQLKLEHASQSHKMQHNLEHLHGMQAKLKEVYRCAKYYIEKMTLKEQYFESMRCLQHTFHAWRGFNTKRAAFNIYKRINGRMNIREHKELLTFCLYAFQNHAREFVVKAKILSTDTEFMEHPHIDSLEHDDEVHIVQDPPPTERQLKQYFLLWKFCCGFARVAGVVAEEHDGMWSTRDLNLSHRHNDEEEATGPPAAAEDKPDRTVNSRWSVSGMKPRKGSAARMSIIQWTEQTERVRDLMSTRFEGSFGGATDSWQAPANAVFYRKFSFNGWKGLSRRGGAARKQLQQRVMDSDAKRVALAFQLWRFRHNNLNANWEKAKVYMESKEYALISRVFSWWARGAWRKRREKVFELRLEHAVWELNDAKLTWEAEVMRLEQELAELTGFCAMDPAVMKKKLRRPKPPPPLPRSSHVGWDAFVDEKFAGIINQGGGEAEDDEEGEEEEEGSVDEE